MKTEMFLQATSVSVEDSVGFLTILAVYLPPKHTAKQEQLEHFYNTLGQKETTVLTILTGDPDSLLPEDMKHSKRWKETT
jgi:hypothetical protein